MGAGVTPEGFARHFATAFAAQDAAGLAAALTEDATVLSLTGQPSSGRDAARQVFQDEFSGIFAAARLVTGKGQLRALTPAVALLHQRYVITGAVEPSGAEMPRFAALLVAVLVEDRGEWRAVSLNFTALS